MRDAVCLVLLLAGAVEALLPGAILAHRTALSQRSGDIVMAGAKALAKKTAVLDDVRGVMSESQLMFCVRSEGLPVNAMNNLRMNLPEGVKLKCVKNTLISIATKEYDNFNAENVDDLLHYSNYWFFAREDKMREALKVWTDFLKATNKKENDVIGGIFDGKLMDAKGVEEVSKLPTKQELMQQTAVLLTVLPAKLARAIDQAGAARIARGLEQARGQKMVRAVKLASEKMP